MTGKPLAALVYLNEKHYISCDTNIIGRSENAFLCVVHQSISRKHCVIEKTTANKFTICDMSATGTFVNGEKLMKNVPRELHHHDKIMFGMYFKSYTFMINKSVRPSLQIREGSAPLKEKMQSLNTSHSIELKRLNNEISQMETEKYDLQQNMKKQLEAQENLLIQERLSLSSQISTTREEAEQKFKKLEEESNAEMERLKREVESKMSDIAQKEAELQQMKDEMEARYKKEMDDLRDQIRDYHVEKDRLLEQNSDLENKLDSVNKILQDKEAEEARRQRELRGLEEELVCSICTEIFIQPTALNCGHVFCKTCIEEWKKKKKICPMCRVKITNTYRMVAIDAIIEKKNALLSTESKELTEKIVHERSKGDKKSSTKKKKTSHHSSTRQVTVNTNVPVNESLPPAINLTDQADPFSWDANTRSRLREMNSPIGGRIEPVTLAAIDLTNTMAGVPRTTATSTVTSASLNGTIDLTDLDLPSSVNRETGGGRTSSPVMVVDLTNAPADPALVQPRRTRRTTRPNITVDLTNHSGL